jgi:hypothetical protein
VPVLGHSNCQKPTQATNTIAIRGLLRPGTGALVRLRRRSHSGVKVPVRPQIHRPVTEGYRAVVTRGGELPEVNCQSVTLIG